MATGTLVGAIDFGTTYSGWSILFKHEFESEPTKGFVKQWSSGTIITEKTPTVVLVKPDGRTLEALGYEAEDRFKELVEADEHNNYYYFRRFKMILNRKLGEKIGRHTLLEDEFGRKLPAIDIFSMAIEYLVDDMHKVAKNRISGAIERDEVSWVLTVPAIWTDSAKEFMRAAGELAGIKSENLSIALEPEAASIFCRHLPVSQRRDDTGVSVSSFRAGDKYIILDAGGGTVDVTVHEVDGSGAVREVVPASGGGWGGTLVDQAFEDLVVSIVGGKVYTEFKMTSVEDWLDLWRDFELKKRTVSPGKDSKVVMKFPASLGEIYSKRNRGRSLVDHIEASEYRGIIELANGRLKFKDTVFKQLFDVPLTETAQHIQKLLRNKQVGKIRAILMVGGFSDSPMLQQKIKDVCSGIDIIIPLEAVSSIMRGAMIFGHSPKAITERVVKYSYGVECLSPFEVGVHPNSKRVDRDFGTYCKQIFSKHVEKGQVVKVGEPQVRQFYAPVNNDQTAITFSIYASELKNPNYTDEGCMEIGEFSVRVSGNKEDKVWVSFTFSGTEIEVVGEDDRTGKNIKVTANFLG